MHQHQNKRFTAEERIKMVRSFAKVYGVDVKAHQDAHKARAERLARAY